MEGYNLDKVNKVGHGWFLLFITKGSEDCLYSEHFSVKSLKEHLNSVKDSHDYFVIPPDGNAYKGSSMLAYLEEEDIPVVDGSERVVFREDYIAILNSKEEEVVGWNKEEWAEDPEVVFSIVNAVRIAYGEPNNTVKEIFN